jgi:hypothetical protein
MAVDASRIAVSLRTESDMSDPHGDGFVRATLRIGPRFGFSIYVDKTENAYADASKLLSLIVAATVERYPEIRDALTEEVGG